MRPVRPLAASIHLAVFMACAAPALAAVDDQGAPSGPVAAPDKLAASARKLIDDAMARQRIVLAALRDDVIPRVMAGSWRLRTDMPYLPRATTPASRPVPNDFADGSISGSTDAASLDVTLGARWRLLHGDASAHVPTAAWMPDLRSADSHSVALRPTLNLSGEWALPDDYSLGVMPGMAIGYTTLGRRQASGTFALTLGKAWSPQWRTFVDVARDRVAVVQLAGVSTSVDAGITFVAASGTQIDFAVTRGLSDTAPPFQAGLGLSSSF
jgi:hypothetical protein